MALAHRQRRARLGRLLLSCFLSVRLICGTERPWWDKRPPPPPPVYSCYRGWDSSHYDRVMGAFMLKPLHADRHATACESNCTNIGPGYNETTWCVTMRLTDIGPYLYECLPSVQPAGVQCTEANSTGVVQMHGRNWTYNCCRATNRVGFPEGTANPDAVKCRRKAEQIFRTFEEKEVVEGSVAGCLEYADRVVFTRVCGTSPGECTSRKCTDCKVLFASAGNHTWCLPQYTVPHLYEVQLPPSQETCGSNNLPSTLRAAWHYGYTSGATTSYSFRAESTSDTITEIAVDWRDRHALADARKTPLECNALSPNASESRWTAPSMRLEGYGGNATLWPPGMKPGPSALTLKDARLPVQDRCWLDPQFDGGGGTCISISAELQLSKSTSEMRAAWSCYSQYLSYFGISCPSGTESGAVHVEALQDAAMKAEQLDQLFSRLQDVLQGRAMLPIKVCNRTHSRILQGLAHLPPKIEYRCCRGKMCNAPPTDIGACFVGEATPEMMAATSKGRLPGEVQNTARGCKDIPGAISGTCVTLTQKIFGRVQTTGMCYSDILKSGYSGMDWIGLSLPNCSSNTSAEGQLYPFDNLPATSGITPPPPETGYVQQTAGKGGARFDYMKADADPVSRPTLAKVQEAGKISFKCCQGFLCNTDAQADGDKILNFSSNVTGIIQIAGFTSPRPSRDFLLYYAQAFRKLVASAIQAAYSHVTLSDVILSSICSSADGCRVLLAFACQDERCRKADADRLSRRFSADALSIPNVSVVVDFQVNLHESDNASHAAVLLNTSDFRAVVETKFKSISESSECSSHKCGASPPLHVDFIDGPYPRVRVSSACITPCAAWNWLLPWAILVVRRSL